MEKILVTLDKDLAVQFREEVLRRYGVERGVLSKAVNEAIRLWLSRKIKTF